MKSKRLVLISIFIFLCSTNIYSQSDSNENFIPRNESFSVQMPFQPRYFAPNKKQPDGKRFYHLINTEQYFFISSDINFKASSYDTILNFVNSNIIKILEKKNDRYDGEYLSFLDTEGFYQKILTVNTANRFYIFHTISKIENDPVIENFFDTLKIKPSAELSKIEAEKILKNQRAISEAKENKNFKDPGDLNATKPTNKVANKNATGPTTGIKILSKIRPAYTSLARIYNLTGIVKVKVTFLSNKKIGGVEAFESLPLGLTNNAILAATKIKFEAPQFKGTPYNVRKTVVYNYLIY